MTRIRSATALALVVAAASTVHPGAVASAGPRSSVVGAVEHADDTVTLPLRQGTSRGRAVWYVVLDASTSAAADAYGVNRANKLAEARGTAAVQTATWRNGVLDFPSSVDFRPQRRVVPGATGFPPEVAVPGAVGEPGYSPLVRLPDGSVLNAPQLANATGSADKVVRLDAARRRVTVRLTHGFARGEEVRYISTESSDPAVAALENATYAPALRAAPRAGADGSDSARASLAALTNGRTGARNPERQGLASALLDGRDPLNVFAWTANQGRYSPLWDVFLGEWTRAAKAARADVRQTSFADVEDLAEDGAVTGPAGGRFRAADVVVNCPIISAG